MQNLIDLFAAGFVFLLFVSVYRKRRTGAVRFWMVGWFFILLHFAVLCCRSHSATADLAISLGASGALLLCGLAFALSREELQESVHRQVQTAALLGVPWFGAVLCASLPHPWFAGAGACAGLGIFSIAFLGLRVFRSRSSEVICLLLVASACAGWLAAAMHSGSADMVFCVVLTECFGLNAILLSFGRPRRSSGTLTMSAGAFAWSLVWVVATLLDRLAPGLSVSPEIWNLPKYIVAAGMILTLLEEEIHAAAVASKQYGLLFAGNPHPMWMYDLKTLSILQVNDAAVAHYGYAHEDFRNLTLLDIFSSDHSHDLIHELRASKPQQLTGPWLHQRQDGSTLQVDIASQPMLRDGRQVIFAMMHDVTERQRLHAQLMRRAHHDVLTDLPNRVLFEGQLGDALEEAARTCCKVAIFCIDLDRFKQINDSLGHAAGDLALKEAARRITHCLQGHGVLARSGGDEFMLFLRDLGQAEDAEIFASRLLRDLRAPLQFGTTDLEIAASVGFAVYPDDGEAIEQLWRDADAAMYQAKRAGGMQWVRVSAEISNEANQANEIELSLRRGLKTGDLEVHYQPQMTIDGQLHSMEALFRSRDPSLKLVRTDRMIAIAEESGLIVPLGNWMLDEICRQLRVWEDAGLEPVQVAVNVSPLQLTRFDFSRQVAKTLERYRLSARMLEFEVTESTVMPDRGGDAPHQIATLARMGIRFSVDDFGTGYSSLGRLHQLPVESLKIDASFTRRIGEFNGTYATVDAIVSLAHTFGLKVVAEGVESEEQMRLLRALGCDRVQGYLFSRPLGAEAATGLLEALAKSLRHEVVA